MRLEGGQLSEDYGKYMYVGLGAGLLVRVTSRIYFRGGILAGGHGPAECCPKGPLLYQGGLEVRF